MINAAVVLRTFLVAQPTLYALTAERIYEERLVPVKGYQPSDGGAICFRSRGGPGLDYSGALYGNSWLFRCYGEDEASADALYRTLVDVLDGAQTGGMYAASLEIAGQLLEEQTLGWHYSLSFFGTIMLAQFEPV